MCCDQLYEGLQEGEDAKSTPGYAPVIEWGTLHINMNIIAQGSLYSMQVDFTNAFIQVPLEWPMYMTLPPGLANQPEYQDKVLKLNWSLYGHKYAANLFYADLEILIEKLGFWVSNHDHCLFLWKDCITVTWLYDAIIIAEEEDKATAIIEKIWHGIR